METPTAAPEPIVAPPPVAPEAPPVSASTGADDPFALDEARLASFSPEQRTVLDDWKKKASDEIQKSGKTVEEKYRPLSEKATALDHLVKNPEFQSWWREQQKTAMQGKPADTQDAIAQTKPQDFATPDEWSQAVLDASNGNPVKLQGIQSRMFAAMATPVVRQLQEKQQMLETTMEMKNLFERHPDAKDLDQIGRTAGDPLDKSPSLLEIAMYYAVDQQGKTIEDGYRLANRWKEALGGKAKQEALGIVQGKKDAVTASPSTSNANKAVVEVGSADELMQRQMQAMMDGITPPRFVIKK